MRKIFSDKKAVLAEINRKPPSHTEAEEPIKPIKSAKPELESEGRIARIREMHGIVWTIGPNGERSRVGGA